MDVPAFVLILLSSINDIQLAAGSAKNQQIETNGFLFSRRSATYAGKT
jgi:hypothetical protein